MGWACYSPLPEGRGASEEQQEPLAPAGTLEISQVEWGRLRGPTAYCTASIAAASCCAAFFGSAAGSLKKLVTTSNTAPCT